MLTWERSGIVVSELQSENALLPMEVIVDGAITSVSDVQPLKVLIGIDVMADGRVMLLSAVHPLKVLFSSITRSSGRLMDSRAVALEKIATPLIFLSELGRLTVLSDSQPDTIELLVRSSTPSSKVIDSSLRQFWKLPLNSFTAPGIVIVARSEK